MVSRYRPAGNKPARDNSASIEGRFAPTGKRGVGVGRASIKRATVDRVAKEGKTLRGKNTGDAFQNFALNLGLGTNNALSQSAYGFYPITRVRTLLEWIHRGSWLGGVAVDLLADDMTRSGVEILTVEDPKKVEEMQQGLTRLRVWQQLSDNIKWSQLYGGSIAVLLIDGQDPSTPLRIETVRKDQFRGLTVFDRWMVDPDLTHLVTEYGPNLGLPEYYKVVADAPAMRGQKIHYTRCIRMEGVRLPYYQRVMENLWGLSVFERLYDRMIAFDSATVGAAQLVYKSFIRTYKIDGLHEAATTAGDALVGISKRVELMRKYQSIEGVTLLDKEDDFATHEASGFTGIADVLIHFAEQISGALQIPLVRLLGQSPAGLNSTGESDLRTYYDNILKRQENDLREGMNLILRVLAQSLQIKLPDNFNFNFVPLWQLNQTEKTDVADKGSRFIMEIEAAGLVSPKVALQELRQLAKTTGYWTNISNKDISEASDVAEPPEPEPMPGEGGDMPGGDPDQGPEEGDEEAGEAAEAGARKGQAAAEKATEKRSQAQIKGLERAKSITKAIGGSGGGDRRWIGKNAAQDAADYSLPFTEIAGLQIVIESARGTIRRGEGWSVVMPADYGYIRRVGSAEGEEEWLDCFIGPSHSSREVWVIDGMKPEGGFDEHKLMLGFTSERDAVAAFKKAYNDGAARRIGAITNLSVDSLAFKNWIARGNKHEAMAPELRAN
jgi:phage-related protein (TIGR01555 family)